MNFYEYEQYQSLIDRVNKVSSDSKRKWGRMSPGQMIHHLNLAIGSGLGYYQLTDRSNLLSRTVVKFVILRVIKAFPRSAKTPSSLKVVEKYALEQEKQQLKDILKKAFETSSDQDWSPHTYFGPLSRNEWGKLIMIHCDHHLRQFGH